MTDEIELSENSDTRDIIAEAMEKHEQAEQQEEVAPEPEESAPEPEKPVRDPWSSWKKEAAEIMRTLPEDAQKYIIERQDQFHKGLDGYREAANFAKSIDKAINPYKDYLGQLGVAPDVAFSNLLRTEKTLRTGSAQEKAEMFQKLAHDYGIDMGQLASIPYDAERSRMKSELAYYQEQLKASNDFRQSQEDAQYHSLINDFGQQHEHFEAVREDMALLLESGKAQTLEDAYVKALRLNDELYAKNMEKQQLSAATQQAQRAKQAAVQVKGSPAGVKSQPVPRTTEEAVRMAVVSLGL